MMRLSVLLALLFAAPLPIAGAWAWETPQLDGEHCATELSRIRTDRPSSRLPDEDRLEAREVERRASALATAYLRVEETLREVGFDPDWLPTQELSWAGVVREDSILIAVYKINEQGQLERVNAFGSEDHGDLIARLALIEPALAHTPRVCGPSYGLLDAEITDHSGDYIYALRLVDRQRELTLGMHYRYTLANEELVHVERMGYACVTTVGGVSEDLMREQYLMSSDPRIRNRADARMLPPASLSVPLPGWSLPPETILYLFHLYPDLHFKRMRVFLSGRAFEVSREDPRIPGWYTRITNPCTVSEE